MKRLSRLSLVGIATGLFFIVVFLSTLQPYRLPIPQPFAPWILIFAFTLFLLAKRSYSTLQHVGIAVGALIVLLPLFTFLPHVALSPDPISPWIYVLAFILGVLAIVRMKTDGRKIWVFVPILLLCIFGFLEEISYGVEPGWVKPITLDTYHVQLYDIHNFIPAIEQIFTHDLQKMDWDFAMSAQLIRADEFILVGLFLFVIAVQWGWQKQKPPAAFQRTFNLLAVFSALASLLAAWWLLSLPADSKNALLFGYSLTRIAILAGLIILGGALPLLALLGRRGRSATPAAKIAEWAAIKRVRLGAGLLLTVILLATLLYQIRAPLIAGTGRVAIVEHLNPLVVWVTAMAALLLLSLPAWRGGLQAFLARRSSGIKAFFANNPAYVYAVFCVLFIGTAQVMDQGNISMGNYIHFPNPWGADWEYWVEETLEMVGAFELLIAVFFFPIKDTK